MLYKNIQKQMAFVLEKKEALLVQKQIQLFFFNNGTSFILPIKVIHVKDIEDYIFSTDNTLFGILKNLLSICKYHGIPLYYKNIFSYRLHMEMHRYKIC